ncbi:hypothetical protein ACP70R_028546 [Stipagrostis hirtigluma subsp. patula]
MELRSLRLPPPLSTLPLQPRLRLPSPIDPIKPGRAEAQLDSAPSIHQAD